MTGHLGKKQKKHSAELSLGEFDFLEGKDSVLSSNPEQVWSRSRELDWQTFYRKSNARFIVGADIDTILTADDSRLLLANFRGIRPEALDKTDPGIKHLCGRSLRELQKLFNEHLTLDTSIDIIYGNPKKHKSVGEGDDVVAIVVTDSSSQKRKTSLRDRGSLKAPAGISPITGIVRHSEEYSLDIPEVMTPRAQTIYGLSASTSGSFDGFDSLGGDPIDDDYDVDDDDDDEDEDEDDRVGPISSRRRGRGRGRDRDTQDIDLDPSPVETDHTDSATTVSTDTPLPLTPARLARFLHHPNISITSSDFVFDISSLHADERNDDDT